MGLSVLLHATVVGLLVYGWWRLQHRPAPVPAASVIDATVVDGRTLPATPAAQPHKAPAPVPEQPADDQALPRPDTSAQQQAAVEQAAHAAAAQQAEARHAAEEAARQQAEQLKEQQVEQAEAEQKARAEAERNRQEQAARAAQQQAEQQAREQAQRKAEEQARADAQRKAAEAAQKQADAAREADLQRSLAAEERVDAARASGALASWEQQIQARIQRAWIRPPTARAGLDCHVYITQVPGGDIVNVKLGSCNGDDATRQSILDAAYRASPLPAPPDPALFERDLDIEFIPSD